jgi:type I restriction enzyme M protein
MTSTPPHTPREFQRFSEITAFIWSVADLLRGDYKQADYGKVILPFTILRRLDCVLDKTREKVRQKYEALKGGQVKNLEPVLNRISGVPFHNTAKFTFEKLKGDPNHLAANLRAFIRGFSTNAQDILERFEF